MGKTNDFADILRRICDNNYSLDDINKILPKLTIICKNCDVYGEELIKIIELLIELDKECRLEMVNKESLDIVNSIYKLSSIFGNMFKITYYEIIKHLLVPYNLNKCEYEMIVYLYQSRFELLMGIIGKLLRKGPYYQFFSLISKYNKELYDLILTQQKCDEILREKEEIDLLIASTLSHMFGVFYFNQDKYENDYQMIEQLAINIINNPDEFNAYCEDEGITMIPSNDKELEKIYAGVNKLLDSAYVKKKEEKRERKR